MSTNITNSFIFSGICLSVLACNGDKDSGDLGLVDLEGVVVDPYQDDAPVPDAWVLVDLGTEAWSVRSGADGSFFLPGVPAAQPMNLTAAKEGYVALTYAGLRVDELDDLSLQLGIWVDGASGEEPMQLTGTVSGGPRGSYLLFYGEDDYLGYASVAGDEPTAFSFEVDPSDDDGVYHLAVMATDSSGVNVLAQGWGAVDEVPGGTAEMTITLQEEFAQVTATANLPVLGGQPMDSLPSYGCGATGAVHAIEAWGAYTGFPDGCDLNSESFVVSLSYLPIPDLQDRVVVSLYEDDDPVWYSYGSFPMEEGAEDVTVQLLDAPFVDQGVDAVFETGASLTWAAVAEVEGYELYVYDGDRLVWALVPLDGNSIDFPAFPEGFDTSIIATGGQWMLDARVYNYDEDGAWDWSLPYRASVQYGGQVVLPE